MTMRPNKRRGRVKTAGAREVIARQLRGVGTSSRGDGEVGGQGAQAA